MRTVNTRIDEIKTKAKKPNESPRIKSMGRDEEDGEDGDDDGAEDGDDDGSDEAGDGAEDGDDDGSDEADDGADDGDGEEDVDQGVKHRCGGS